MVMLDTAYKMLQVCQECSPTGVEQAAFTKLYRDLLFAGHGDMHVIHCLAEVLITGLVINKWPKPVSEEDLNG